MGLENYYDTLHYHKPEMAHLLVSSNYFLYEYIYLTTLSYVATSNNTSDWLLTWHIN